MQTKHKSLKNIYRSTLYLIRIFCKKLFHNLYKIYVNILFVLTNHFEICHFLVNLGNY